VHSSTPPKAGQLKAVLSRSAAPTSHANGDDVPLAPGEVLVRMSHVSLSADDALMASQHVRGATAVSVGQGIGHVLGHAGVGVVIASGGPSRPGATDPSRLIRERVAINAIIACARCERCRAGLSMHCQQRGALGCWNRAIEAFGLVPRPGVLQTQVVVPATAIEVIPKGVPDDVATLANTLAGAMQAIQSVRIEHKPYVTVLGDGAMGLLVAQVLARLNASVRVLGQRPQRLALCERWGLKHRDVREVGMRQDQDVVVVCTGQWNSLELAQRLIRPRGRIVIKSPLWPLAHAASVVEQSASLVWAADNEAEMAFAGHGSLRDALDALARGDVDVTPMLSPRVTVDHVGAGMAALREHEALRVLVEIA